MLVCSGPGFDFCPECGIFEPLKDKACFDQARLDLGVVIWPNGVDIDPAWMYEQIKINKSWSPFDFPPYSIMLFFR